MPATVSEAFGQCPLQALTFGQPLIDQSVGLDDHSKYFPTETILFSILCRSRT